MSGWWLAFSARKPSRTTKAMASPNPSKPNSLTISSPSRSHPSSFDSPCCTSSPLSLAMCSSSSSERVSFPQNLAELQDLARRHHTDEAPAGVDHGKPVDVCGLHGADRLAQGPVRAAGGQVVAGDRGHGRDLPLFFVDAVELVHPRHAQVLMAVVDDRHRLLPVADQVKGEELPHRR